MTECRRTLDAAVAGTIGALAPRRAVGLVGSIGPGARGWHRLFGVALVPLIMLPLLLVTGVKQAGADSYRSDWNISEYFPSCAPYGEYPINYVTCLPDNTAPSSTTSLVYGQLVFANGDPVEDYQYEGAAGYADLGINGANPYGGNDVTEETPVWDGYFAFILPKDDDDPTIRTRSAVRTRVGSSSPATTGCPRPSAGTGILATSPTGMRR